MAIPVRINNKISLQPSQLKVGLKGIMDLGFDDCPVAFADSLQLCLFSAPQVWIAPYRSPNKQQYEGSSQTAGKLLPARSLEIRSSSLRLDYMFRLFLNPFIFHLLGIDLHNY